jgi:hypothetical protein
LEPFRSGISPHEPFADVKGRSSADQARDSQPTLMPSMPSMPSANFPRPKAHPNPVTRKLRFASASDGFDLSSFLRREGGDETLKTKEDPNIHKKQKKKLYDAVRQQIALC